MTSPLHPTLFQALQARFGDVRITNAGQQQVARRVPDPMRPGRFITRADQRGEQYVVPCPFCNDDRFRLYVSYMYGRKDPTTRPNYRLWCCQNEKCHESEANRRLFRSMVAVPLGRRQGYRAAAAAPTSVPSSPQPQEIVLPEGLIPISSLPNTHPAPAYLQQRGFDLAYLTETWGISFCDSCLNCRPVATNRIVVPICRPAQMFAPATGGQQELVLGGWQARIVPGLEPLSGPDAKYVSAAGMQKSELLYGLHLAIATQGPVYVVEGPSDCWRIGRGAVAIFGKDLSMTQKLLLVHHFVGRPIVGRPIVVMLDPDAYEAADKIQHDLFLARSGTRDDNRVVIADVPPHREDPADCTREEIAGAVQAALAQPAAAHAISNNKLISPRRQ